MANNVVLRSIDLTAEWTPLSSEPLVADVTVFIDTITTSHTLDSNAQLRCGTEIISAPVGRLFPFTGIDLSTLEGRADDTNLRLFAIGNTRWGT